MSRIRVRLKPNNGIKVRTQTTYLYDPTIIDAEVQQAKDWATKTDGLVEEEGEGVDYSAKAYATGGTGTETNNAKYYAEQAGISETNASNSATAASGSASAANSSALLAKDWATKTDGTVDGVDYSSKYYAQQITPIATDITTVAGIASNVTTVAGISSNVTSVAGNATNINAVNANKTNIDTVAGISSDVTTVADNISGVNTVASISSAVTNVSGISSDVSDVASIKADVQGVNAISSDIEAVVGNTTNINTVASNILDVESVAANISNVNAVADNETNINAVNSNKTNINAVAGNASNINAVAGNASNINAVAGNATNINAVNANKTNIDAVAGDLTNIDSVANDLTNIDNASTYANNAHIWAEGSDVQVAGLGGEKSSKGWAARAKELVDSIGSVLHYKGSVATRADLPASGQVLGDMYNITSDGSNVVWNGSDWDEISGIVDLSQYRKASDQDTIDAGKVDKVTTASKVYGTDASGNQTTYDKDSFGQVDDVQVNGTSIVTNKVANIPKAAQNVLGVVQQYASGSWGVISDSNGYLKLAPASETSIKNRSNGFMPITVSNLDIAIREGLGNNTLTWTDAYKLSAAKKIGVPSGVQAGGTDLTPDSTTNKVNVPVASANNFGVAKINTVYGIGITANGELRTSAASDAEIESKSNTAKPLVPASVNKAVMEGLGNNSLTWTDAYKTSARNTIGASKVSFVDWID